jgi:hypothetical protein
LSLRASRFDIPQSNAMNVPFLRPIRVMAMRRGFQGPRQPDIYPDGNAERRERRAARRDRYPRIVS